MHFPGARVTMEQRFTFRFQAVFAPSAQGLFARIAGCPETLRIALKPLKASNQPAQIELIIVHAAALNGGEPQFFPASGEPPREERVGRLRAAGGTAIL
jgi:hypothetical protein